MKGILKTVYYFISVLLLISVGYCSLSFATILAKPIAQQVPSSFHYIPTIDIAQYALHQGDARSANLIEGFIPLYSRRLQNLLFTDIRFYNPNGTPLEGNIDLGYRRIFHQGERLLGLYAGYDRYRSQTRCYYSQIHAGLELWLNRLFIGGNGYLPVGTKAYDNDGVNAASLVSTSTSYRYNIAYAQGKERALPGGDAEIGYDITRQLTLYGGGYYFNHSDVKSISGPKLRATYTFYRSNAYRLLRLFDRIRLEGLISHDSTRGTSWLAGIRFSFGLSRYNMNPTTDVSRHIVDPIRRDLNGISENFNEPSALYMIDGRPARVDLVDNSGDRTIEQAVSGNPGTSADIIGVRGVRTTNTTLTIGSRHLTVTGGKYDFKINGHPYSILIVGNNGQLTQTSPTNDLFNVSGSAGFTLEHLTISDGTNNGNLIINTDGNTFGQIVLYDLISDSTFSLYVDGTNQSGTVFISGNTLALTHPTGNNSGFKLQALNGAKLTINSIVDNKITTYNSITNPLNYYGIEILASNLGDVTVNQGIKNNTITMNHPSANAHDGIYIQSENQSDIMINGGIIHNIIDTRGSNSSMANAIALGAQDSNSTLIINGGMKNNTLFTTNDSWAVTFFGGGLFTLNGGFIANNATSESNSTRCVSFGGNAAGSVSINDGFYNNHVTLDSSIGVSAISIGYTTGTYILHVGDGKGTDLTAVNNIIVSQAGQQLQTIGNVTIVE